MGIDHGLQLANDMPVLNGVLGHFMAIISCIWCLFYAFLCNFGTIAIKTDLHFGSHVLLVIRYMTNDNNLRCYIGVLGVSMTSFEFFLLFYGILANLSVFGDLYSGNQDGFCSWDQIGDRCKCFESCFGFA